MKRWYSKSIQNKLIGIVLLAIVPALLLTSVTGAFREAKYQRQSYRQELHGIAAALAASVSEPLASGDKRQVANALKGISAISTISYVSVRDAAGNLVFQFGNGVLMDGGGNDQGAGNFNVKTFPVEAEIRNGGKAIGRLLLIGDVSRVREALMRSLFAALVTGLVASAAGLLATQRMKRSVSDPLLELARAMSHVRETKDFTHGVERTSEDETGQLVEAFNDMMGEIRQRDQALCEYRAGLEQQVRERTRDLALAVDEAESANRAKSDFLATMSHEIRTPMNGMLVMAELLAAGNLEPRAQRQCEVILRSGQTLLSILNDILDLSKIESGQLTLEPLPTGLARIVDDVLNLFSEHAASKRLQLAAYVSPAVPAQVLADPIRLSQILSNLVNNALKFTETGGVLVRVDTGSAPGRIKFSITDTGIGIPESKLSAIFEPFTQAEQSTSRRFGGTGIGLTICRKLATAMGGTLSVESAMGGGSTFSFEAPFQATLEATEARDCEPRGLIAVAVQEGPLHDAIVLNAADVGLQPCDVELADTAHVVVTTPDRLPAIDTGTSGRRPTLLLTNMGDAPGTRLLESGETDAVLDLPFASCDLRKALRELLSGNIAPAKVLPSKNSYEDAPAFKGVRALAADDSPVNREVLKEALHRLGVDVICVEDGASAVALAKSHDFDLVFMDGSMPVLDGFAATRAIRSFEAESGRPAVPIIGLSAHVIGIQAKRWQNDGMSDFITKPFTLATIRNCVERWTAMRGRELGNEPAETEPAGESGEMSSLLIDDEVLQSIRGMQRPGDQLVERIIGLYVKHAPPLLDTLLDCEVRQHDLGSIASAAHALKSLCRNVGAIRLGDLCDRVEEDARAGICSLEAHRQSLELALAQTLEQLGELTEAAPGGGSPGQQRRA